MSSKTSLELLTPAGDFEKLKFALVFGSDAVYAGQPQFSLRSRENSFKISNDIADAIEYTHSKNKKFYLASNIIPHNNKIEAFQKSLSEFIEMKPDALIMTDPGIIHFVRQNFPKQDIHLSVQANCTNWSTAKFWRDLGIKRIILSRELNIREISLIHEKVPDLELEVFVHGAICMAYSGRCLLSNYMSHRDSNQGACSNACRFKYSLYAQNEAQDENYTPLEGQFYLKEETNQTDFMPVDEDEYGTYIMNSKDMCAIEHLEKLQKAGVVSFKVEGRTKSLYYLVQVTRTYSQAIQDLQQGKPFNSKLMDQLYQLDHRGYIPGFFIHDRSDLKQNYEQTRVRSETAHVAGVIRGYNLETKQAVLSVKGQIYEGDELMVITAEIQTPNIIKAKNLMNHRGEFTDKISPGMDNCKIKLDQDPGEFAILIKLLTPVENLQEI